MRAQELLGKKEEKYRTIYIVNLHVPYATAFNLNEMKERYRLNSAFPLLRQPSQISVSR